MSYRVTELQVQEIMDTALDVGDITPYIGVANNIVTTRLTSAGHSATTLADIERFLTAHLIAITKERQAMEEHIGDVWVKYQGSFGKFLESTTYGQMVLTLDSSGKMSKVGLKEAKIQAIYQVDADNDDTLP